jgi:hypothetical protein
MGSLHAREFANQFKEDSTTLEQSIMWHLRGNHYPPVPESMVTPCIDAIFACVEADDELLIELPEGVLWRGHKTAPAWAMVEAYHLQPWIDEILDEPEA